MEIEIFVPEIAANASNYFIYVWNSCVITVFSPPLQNYCPSGLPLATALLNIYNLCCICMVNCNFTVFNMLSVNLKNYSMHWQCLYKGLDNNTFCYCLS